MKLFLCQCFVYFLLTSVVTSQEYVNLPVLQELFNANSNDKEPIIGEQYYTDLEDYESKPEDTSEQVDNNNKLMYQIRDWEDHQNRDKRMQITCEVIKTREDFYEPGYEFIPSTYVNTTCVAKRTCDPSFNDNSGRKQFCVVRNVHCRTNFKEMTVFKRKIGFAGWHIHKIQQVAVGCCDHH